MRCFVLRVLLSVVLFFAFIGCKGGSSSKVAPTGIESYFSKKSLVIAGFKVYDLFENKLVLDALKRGTGLKVFSKFMKEFDNTRKQYPKMSAYISLLDVKKKDFWLVFTAKNLTIQAMTKKLEESGQKLGKIVTESGKKVLHTESFTMVEIKPGVVVFTPRHLVGDAIDTICNGSAGIPDGLKSHVNKVYDKTLWFAVSPAVAPKDEKIKMFGFSGAYVAASLKKGLVLDIGVELKSSDMAKVFYIGLNMGLANNAKSIKDPAAKELLKYLRVKQDGKFVRANMSMPEKVVQTLLSQNLPAVLR